LPLNFNIKFYRFECYEYITAQTDHGRPDPFDPPVMTAPAIKM